jgi:aspartate/methionine/tyrosine aminotransferase
VYSSTHNTDVRSLFLNYWKEVERHPNCIDLGMGMPPLSIFESALGNAKGSVLEKGRWRVEYQHQAGDKLLREALSSFESTQIGVTYTPENIMLTSGALRGFSLALECLVKEETKIVEIVPTYPLCAGQARKVVGENSVITITPKDTETFEIKYEEIELYIQPNTIIYLTNPNNPTGRYVSDDFLYRLVESCEREGAYLIIDQASDIPFSHSSKDDSYLASPSVIRIRSLAKNYLLAGLRVGYIVAHPHLINLFSESFSFSDGNAPCIANDLIIGYLKDPHLLPSIANIVKYKVDVALKELNKCPSIVRTIRPEGCFYIFIEIKYSYDSWCLFKELVTRGINVLPGCLFGVHTAPWIRICCGREDRVLVKHIEQLNRILSSL